MLYAAWLVQTGQFQRVRLFFLPKGHTHILIDQIFGRVTVGCRGKNIPSLPAFLKLIQQKLGHQKKYDFKEASSLPHTWNWDGFLKGAPRHKIAGFATGECNVGEWSERKMGANILSHRLHNRSREHHSHTTRFAEAMQATSSACMQTAPNPAEGKARRHAGKEKQPKWGKGKGKGNACNRRSTSQTRNVPTCSQNSREKRDPCNV